MPFQDNEQISLFESVVSFSDDAIITKSLAGMITSWNNAAEALFGYTADEIIGRHVSIIIPPELIGEEAAIIDSIRAGKQVRHYETERLRKDGSRVFISLTISPLKDKNGAITGASKIARDITKQKQEEQYLRLLESAIANTTDAILITEAHPLDEPGPRIVYANDAFTKMTGYAPADIIGKTPRILQGPKSDKNELKRLSESLSNGRPCEITTINYKKNGEQFWINFNVNPVFSAKGRVTHFIAIERDVTFRKNEELQQSLLFDLSLIFNENQPLHAMLHSVLQRMMQWDSFRIAEIWLIDREKTRIELATRVVTPAAEDFAGQNRIDSMAMGEGLPGITWETAVIQCWNDIDKNDSFIRKESAGKAGISRLYGIPLSYNNDVVGVLIFGLDGDTEPGAIFDHLLERIGALLGKDILIKQMEHARKKAEMAVTRALEERNLILESIDDAFFAVDKNWTVTYWNNMAEQVLGKPKSEVLGRNLWAVYKDSINSDSYNYYHKAVATNQAVHFEDYYPPLRKWYEISAYPAENGLSVYFKDVSERKVAELKLADMNESLVKQARKLEISNAELEQFAYVASHDLQEPLRMVTSFLTQLETKYSSVIDDKGRKYIFFAVDGAKRMRQIILDLLEFSRVGRTEADLEEVDINVLINDILTLYRHQIRDSGAMIRFAHLPVLVTCRAPIMQIFQNLISNGLKYQKQGATPVIDIACEDKVLYWQFSVKDNGIGIDPEYFDKIFIIFQRLHNKDEYSGTGMGLAITKKIIENLGGKIWLTSEKGAGTTFHFTLLKNAKQ